MSFESTDDRLERLEKTVSDIVVMQRDFLNNSIIPMHQAGLQITKLVLLVMDDLKSMQRFLASQPIFGDAKARQSLLDIISRNESQLDFLTKKLSDIVAQFEKLNPVRPPEIPPGS